MKDHEGEKLMATRFSNEPINLLIVEDSKNDVLLFSHLLGPIADRCRITDVPRLIDAFKCIDEQKFDIILLDLNLLDIDGIANVAALKAECNDTPIIVYSGNADARIQQDARMLGIADFLIKGESTPARIQQTVLDVHTRRAA